jgi:spore coat polysaccharide biosynthesis protein SpsF
MAKVLAVVQARMSSTRLPGKSLADVGGEPMLSLLLQRLQRSRKIDGLVIATSIDRSDDAIEATVQELGRRVYRGDRDDVLARFVGAANGHRGPVVRITADCPLIDPSIADEVIDLFLNSSDCDYASNIEPRTYPDGLDVEVVSHELLERIAASVDEPSDREHVTSAIRRDVERLRSASLVLEENLGDLRWTVDTSDDLGFVRQVVARLERRRYAAGMTEILAAIRAEPSLACYHGRRG